MEIDLEFNIMDFVISQLESGTESNAELYV